MALSSNPNFPPNLSIKPSLLSSIAQQDLSFGIAGRTWEASYTLLDYLLTSPLLQSQQEDITIVEIGGGNGFLGISLVEKLLLRGETRGGIRLILTDLEEVLPLLEKNLRDAELDLKGGGMEVLIRALPWGDQLAFEHLVKEFPELVDGEGNRKVMVIGSDLVYFPELYPLLLKTLLWLSSGKEKEMLISYKIRSLVREEPFWSALGRWFELTPLELPTTKPLLPSLLPLPSLPPKEAHLLSLSRKPTTLTIEIPLENEQVMRGSTNDKIKEDDQFEIWLLGGIEV